MDSQEFWFRIRSSLSRPYVHTLNLSTRTVPSGTSPPESGGPIQTSLLERYRVEPPRWRLEVRPIPGARPSKEE